LILIDADDFQSALLPLQRCRVEQSFAIDLSGFGKYNFGNLLVGGLMHMHNYIMTSCVLFLYIYFVLTKELI